LKKTAKFLISALLPVFLGLVLVSLVPGRSALAQQNSAAQQARASTEKAEHMDAPATDPMIEQYLHSSTVQAIARWAHVSTDTAAVIFEDLNSGVLLFAVFWLLWKTVPKLLRSRSENLQRELVGARKATEDANQRLSEVEARLLRLDSEIAAIRQQVEREAVDDEKRIHATLEAERERIIASAEQEITALQAAAQRDLKKFAADLAIDNAMRRMQLSADTDRTLIKDFGKRLGRSNSGGEA
jgi:F-type H+-transporting ATPase subunit b